MLNQTAKCASTLQWACLPDGVALSDSVLGLCFDGFFCNDVMLLNRRKQDQSAAHSN